MARRAFLAVGLICAGGVLLAEIQPVGHSVSPAHLVTSPDGSVFHVAHTAAPRLDSFEAATLERLRSIELPGNPTGLALSGDGRVLHVTCSGRRAEWRAIDTATGKTLRAAPTGNSALAPALSPDGATVWVCCRFLDRLEQIRIADGTVLRRVPVAREPIAAAMTPDGRHLLVAHHLPEGAADEPPVAAGLTVVDTTTGTVAKRLALPNGATGLRELRLSPDGRHACVTHLIARFYAPTTQLSRGWMNNNALTLLDVASLSVIGTVLLDDVDRGAANPWGATWTPDGRTLCIAHAGTHEVSLIDFPGLLGRLAAAAATARPGVVAPSDDLAFLVGLRRRLPLSGRGPRALVAADSAVFVASYFSGTLERLDPVAGTVGPARALGPSAPLTLEQQGERWFNDASICFQGWQSCASCHGEEARVDGINWDLLNDGVGNPKNTRSLVWAHRTPPAMSSGVRETAESAVRAGIRSILFSTQPEPVAVAIDAWLKSLRPSASPHLQRGKLSPAARRGRALFRSDRLGCAACHASGLFTDQQAYDVGTSGPLDSPMQAFDTPALVELWRTAPFLHDGSAASLREVVTRRNVQDQHGHTSDLKPGEIDDLVQYLLTL